MIITISNSRLAFGALVCVIYIGLMLLVQSCTSADTTYGAVDPYGYVYPVECQRDLSDVRTPDGRPPLVLQVTPDRLDEVKVKHNYPASSRLLAVTYAQRIIMMDNTLRGWVAEAVLHHEQCHVLMGEWHKERR